MAVANDKVEASGKLYFGQEAPKGIRQTRVTERMLMKEQMWRMEQICQKSQVPGAPVA